MKKIFCAALTILAFAAPFLFAACGQTGGTADGAAGGEEQDPIEDGQQSEEAGGFGAGSVDIKITQTPHCTMQIFSEKEQYTIGDTVEFRYELDAGYALDGLLLNIQTPDGEVYERKTDFTEQNLLIDIIGDWKSVAYTPVVTDKVRTLPEIRTENEYGGSGAAEWMFACVPERQTQNWLILEPDENSYISDVATYGRYDEPAMEGEVPMGGYRIGGYSYRYDAYSSACVSLELPGPPADEVYIGVTFIAKEHASVLQFCCKNDFERAEPSGDWAAALSTVTAVADNSEPYYYTFVHENNYNAILANGYAFIGWADEAGEIVCETLDGAFDASRDATFFITFRDIYE